MYICNVAAIFISLFVNYVYTALTALLVTKFMPLTSYVAYIYASTIYSCQTYMSYMYSLGGIFLSSKYMENICEVICMDVSHSVLVICKLKYFSRTEHLICCKTSFRLTSVMASSRSEEMFI